MGLHKCWLFFIIWTSLQPLSSNFLNLFQSHVQWLLKSFGVFQLILSFELLVILLIDSLVISLMYNNPRILNIIYINWVILFNFLIINPLPFLWCMFILYSLGYYDSFIIPLQRIPLTINL